MTFERKNTARNRILVTAQHAVKSQIVAAGLAMGQLAGAAGISQSSLSNHIGGARANYETQIRIWQAFCRLTGQAVSLADFWGELLSKRIAG